MEALLFVLLGLVGRAWHTRRARRRRLAPWGSLPADWTPHPHHVTASRRHLTLIRPEAR